MFKNKEDWHQKASYNKFCIFNYNYPYSGKAGILTYTCTVEVKFFWSPRRTLIFDDAISEEIVQ
jgi:hypothetical protein